MDDLLRKAAATDDAAEKRRLLRDASQHAGPRLLRVRGNDLLAALESPAVAERKVVPITPGASKGGQNPPDPGAVRPAPPQGSGGIKTQLSRLDDRDRMLLDKNGIRDRAALDAYLTDHPDLVGLNGIGRVADERIRRTMGIA